MASLEELNSAVRVREAMKGISKDVVESLYPRPRYATVISVDIPGSTATLQYPNETVNFPLPTTMIAPSVGGVVRVSGVTGARYIDEIVSGTVQFRSHINVNGRVTSVDTVSGAYYTPAINSGSGLYAYDSSAFFVPRDNAANLRIHAAGDAYIDASTLYFRNVATNVNYGYVSAGSIGIYGNIPFYFATWGGGWYMSDGTWIRAYNDRYVWLNTGWYGTNGGLTINYGGATSGTYSIYNNGSIYSAGAIDCGGNASVGGQLAAHYPANGNGYAVQALFAETGFEGGNRAGVGFHPGGVGGSIQMLQNNPSFNFLDTEGVDPLTDFLPLYAADYLIGSSAESKQDIEPWRPEPGSSESLPTDPGSVSVPVGDPILVEPPVDPVDPASLSSRELTRAIEIVSFRRVESKVMRTTTFRSPRRQKAFVRLNLYLAHRNLPAYPYPLHVCTLETCGGTELAPCAWRKNWEQPQVGLVVENIAALLPEVVAYAADGSPGAINLSSLLGVALRTIQELDLELTNIAGRLALLEG